MPEFVEQFVHVAAIVVMVVFVAKHTYDPVLEALAPYFDWAYKQRAKVRERELSHARAVLSRHQEERTQSLRTSDTHVFQQSTASRQFAKQLVTKHARQFPQGKVPVGFLKETPLRWYVDLRDAVLEKSTRESLSAALANHIRGVSHLHNPVTYSRVAVPEPGNQLLGVAVAEQLGVPAVVVKSAIRRINDFDVFDGIVRPGDAVILVDDVITSGAMIRESVEILRNIGATVAAVFAVVSRKDPAEWPELASLDSPVHVFPILRLSDSDIDELEADH